ncbi:unnamed protein product [Closterium sp. Naga37s-1]|nr:unnamed protein product [Closterium sp. Naga37s-1]
MLIPLRRLAQHPSDTAAHLILLAFSRLVLRLTAAAPSQSLTAACALLTQRFISGDWHALLLEASAAATPAARPLNLASARSTATQARLHRAARFAKCGDWSRSLAALEAGEFAPPSPETISSLSSKHPPAPQPLPQWISTFTPDSYPQLSAPLLHLALRSAPRGTAAGPLGWFIEHLRDTFLTSQQHLPSLLRLFQNWLQGELPLSDCTTPLGVPIAPNGLNVAGVPIGSDGYIISTVQEKLASFAASLPLLHQLHDPQTASRILSQCVSARPSFLLRTVSPFPEIHDLFSSWDSTILDHFTQLFGPGYWIPDTEQTKTAQQQVFLPIRLGGFGLRSAASTAPLSYLCSWAQSLPLLSTHFITDGSPLFRPFLSSDTIHRLDEFIPAATNMLPKEVRDRFPSWSHLLPGYPPKLFTHLLQQLEASLLEKVRSSVTSPLRLARLTSLQGPHAGDWLTAAPSSPLPPIPCPKNNEPTRVHDAIKHELHRITLELGLVSQLEDHHLLPGRRPDITCRDLQAGTTLALDISVADPQHGFPHSNAATVIGSAATTRETEKATLYAPSLRARPDVKLLPLALETFGCFGKTFQDFLRECSRRGASRLRDLSGSSDLIPQLFETSFYKRISLVHQREQARTVCRRAQGFNEEQPMSGQGQSSDHALLLGPSTTSASSSYPPLPMPNPSTAAAAAGPNGAAAAPPPPFPFPPPLSPSAPFFQMPPPAPSFLPFSLSLPFTSLLSPSHQIDVPLPASAPFPPQPYSPHSPTPLIGSEVDAAVAAAAAAAAAGGAAGGAAMGTPVSFPGLAQPMGTRVLFSHSPTLLKFTIPPQQFSLKALPQIIFALSWTAFVAFWTRTAVSSSAAPVVFILFSLPFWAVGIGLLAYVLLRHIMDETVTVDPATCQLTIRRAVNRQTLPFFGLSTAHTALIHGAGVNYTMQDQDHHHSPPITFCQLTMAGGERLSFGSRLSLAEQRWLSLHIASFLQVPWFQPPFLQSY